MGPSEFLISGAIAVSLALPFGAIYEAQNPPVDMKRYQVENCGEELCIVDQETGKQL